jgi:adenine nucleotide transporter 17
MTARKSHSEDTLPGSKPAKSLSTLQTFLRILNEEGLAGLFAGVGPALVLVANPILQYTIFEQLKYRVEKRRRVTPTDSFYLGAVGKLMATSITYPYITVKSRMHVAGKDGPKDDMITSFKKIVDKEGVKGLYGGQHHYLLM